MKRLLLMIFVSCISITSMMAQTNSQSHSTNGKARIAQQVKHYVELFSLTSTDAEQFTTLYQEYNKQLRAIHTQYFSNSSEKSEQSEQHVEQQILDNFSQSRAILDVREQYYRKFRTILTPSQVLTIFEDEKQRREHLRQNQTRQ